MCQIQFSVSCGVSPVKSTGHTSYVLYLLCASIATGIVAIGGLGAVQNQCATIKPEMDGIVGFSPLALPCKEVFRYYWFIIAYLFVVATAALVIVSSGRLIMFRNALVGLFSISLLLWIYMSNAFLSLNDVDALTGEESLIRDRIRTVVAGSIMTATLTAFDIIALGYKPEETSGDKPSVSLEQAAVGAAQ